MSPSRCSGALSRPLSLESSQKSFLGGGECRACVLKRVRQGGQLNGDEQLSEGLGGDAGEEDKQLGQEGALNPSPPSGCTARWGGHRPFWVFADRLAN